MVRKPSVSAFFRPLIILLFLLLVHPSVFAEEIRSFSTDVEIRSSGTIGVSEHIEYDFGSARKHGITRQIPVTKTNARGQQYRYAVSRIGVTDPAGKPYPYTSSLDGNDISLRIGDANTLVSGVVDYIVSYEVSGALTYYSDHDELYWNATGNGSAIPIQNAKARILLPTPLQTTDAKAACYTGGAGSNEHACTASYENNVFSYEAGSVLGPGEGLTVVAGFPKGIVRVLEPAEVTPFSDTTIGRILILLSLALAAIGAIIWYLAIPIWIVVSWIRTGRDPIVPLGVTNAWFSPPKTASGRLLTPGETGTVVDETVDMRDITATIVDLARRGYLKIVERKGEAFVLEKRDPTDKQDTLQPFEQLLYSAVFSGRETFSMKAGSLADTVGRVKSELYESVVREGFFGDNPQKIRNLYIVLGVLGVFSMNFPLIIASFFFGIHMPKKTIKGATAANIAKSLRNFLTSQERQLEFQAKNKMMFEGLLPYAIAFGVEKVWAKRFAGVDLAAPEWYEGYGNSTSFNAPVFVGSLDRSMGAFAAAGMPVSTTSSSSGFSSGFSGGFSGGGGGGGSVGSW